MLFWIFEGICFGLPVLALIIRICKAVQEDREAARKAAEKAKAAEEKRLLAEKKKAEKDAESAQKQQEKEAARRPVGRPRKQQATPPVDADPVRAESKTANVRAFEGQHVAFTGTLPGMTRKEAIAAVTERGGRAYNNMPACTTILVVGNIRGDGSTEKLEKADEWIGQVRKITAAEFMAMLHEDTEPEMNFEQFAAAFAA